MRSIRNQQAWLLPTVSKPRRRLIKAAPLFVAEALEARTYLTAYALNSIASFMAPPNGTHPRSQLVMDSSGDLFGTARSGGANNDGTVFEIVHGTTAITVLASFNGANGANPYAGVTLDASGDVFGTSYSGGASNDGTVFEIVNGTNAITTLASFNGANGANPYAAVTLDGSGDIFGTTYGGGANAHGTVFEIAHGTNAITTLTSFNYTNGVSPYAGLTIDASGDLFGTTEYGGAYGDGTVFEMVHDMNAITILASFNGTNGAGPIGGVTLDASGDLFGTAGPGSLNAGTVFEIVHGTTDITVLASFNGTNGANPYAGVSLDAGGDLFGTTYSGGANKYGSVFEIVHGTSAITTLASFNVTNGVWPYAGVAFDASGDIFGTTYSGGANDAGTVFEIVQGTSAITTLAGFDSTNAQNPLGGVTLDASGDLFGTTGHGGANNDGTVFEIVHDMNAITILASFNGTNGASPESGVTLDANGDLFGTTESGGTYGDGTVFEIVHGTTTITTLANFNGTNGEYPSGVTLDASGDLFGTTHNGGASGGGTVFEIVHGAMAITDLASFNDTNGPSPEGGVTIDASGNLFGTTVLGGANGDGTVFEIVHGTMAITTLASFSGTNGASPFAGASLDASGDLFGTTFGGYVTGGTVFEVVQGTTTITNLATFNRTNGIYPEAGVTLDGSGDVFGTTSEGGANGNGTVFEIVQGTSTITTLANFNGANGDGPSAVIMDASGNLFGTTGDGGICNLV